MSGIYIHIPFCKQACHYCDFHFSTNLKTIDVLVDAICKEIELRKDYLNASKIATVYFGGGTPSLLSLNHLEKILTYVHRFHQVEGSAEITLEANPDDIDKALLDGWRALGINRVSLGIQTFNNDKLTFINRSHHSGQAEEAIALVAKHFPNFNADLIYAIPPADQEIWKADVSKLLSYEPPHISVYGLTIEEKTVFGKWSESGKLKEISDMQNLDQYELGISLLEDAGYVHYEVSNFSKPGKYSVHNTSYWRGETYLGIGPGAHSYDKASRSWNISNNQKYIQEIQNNQLPQEAETLTKADHQNEYMLTRIRNIWGIDLAEYAKFFDEDFIGLNQEYIGELVKRAYAKVENNCFLLTKKGWFIADEISAHLMV